MVWLQCPRFNLTRSDPSIIALARPADTRLYALDSKSNATPPGITGPGHKYTPSAVRCPTPSAVVVEDCTPTPAPELDLDTHFVPSSSSECERGRSAVVDPPLLVEQPSGACTPVSDSELTGRRRRGLYDASPFLYLGRTSVLVDLVGAVGRKIRPAADVDVAVVAVGGMGCIPLSMLTVIRMIEIEAVSCSNSSGNTILGLALALVDSVRKPVLSSTYNSHSPGVWTHWQTNRG